ncbi:MAG TPA: SoxR reducing system RseC family protein [Pseudomonadales bacterium]|nr:SoxR reducing system RseC family protein [Pseudomonadales bacterium]
MSQLNVESARVVAISAEAIWVDTIQRSTCNACSSRAGCGQYAMNKLSPQRHTHLKIPLGHHSQHDFAVGTYVKIGVPEGLVLKSALVVYILPLLVMIGGAMIADRLFGTDLAAGLGGALGLALGFVAVRAYSSMVSTRQGGQPVLVASTSQENCYIPAKIVELSH